VRPRQAKARMQKQPVRPRPAVRRLCGLESCGRLAVIPRVRVLGARCEVRGGTAAAVAGAVPRARLAIAVGSVRGKERSFRSVATCSPFPPSGPVLGPAVPPRFLPFPCPHFANFM